jgi:hypothetical protein
MILTNSRRSYGQTVFSFLGVPLGFCASIVAFQEGMHVDEKIVQIS